MTASRRRTRSGRIRGTARHLAFQAWRLLLSFAYLMLSAMLVTFGVIAGWAANSGRPVLGSFMILAGLAVFLLGPRAIRRITGQDPIDPPVY